MSIIEVRALNLTRNRTPVLHGVSLSVEQGEIFVLIGPSGSGKSSLLRCLNRLEEPAPQTVFLNGDDITSLPVTTLRCRVGMVFQQSSMFPGTVADNLAYGPSLRKETLPRERLVELLEQVALDPALLDKRATELSGGQAQRVAIARALANRPDVLLLDEPTSALDPIATHAVEQTLHDLRARLNLTLIWVSHMVEQARRVADRVLMLDAGRVVRIDTVDAMLDPQHGDPRVLAFAKGDDGRMQDEDEPARTDVVAVKEPQP
ncbi:MAG TPA: phosphate ABC transporter ATP-binding protein [Aggregatilinea sp.]|uniref:ABC transporter ATP-binding protein n=1 Tax=Aggregatilinea sp. TaxID=2806333 RepID=UPI002B7F9EE0|nr:phosphate ABC transporter ATP-binding protein [Aggregatilinea sp.]HML21498.1 phosphate ABC transporter ATP-binding protein [Aggregatilinea sp.]